ncbi:mediator of RNA polymerase II transcription subunit 1-like [Ascaphus truei]|uniref:mediator of RNA polymerase II transcription subunit 1-like n=1 Tax=Ascaphus truei TaxID=8439 RepID=UPI003F594F7D
MEAVVDLSEGGTTASLRTPTDDNDTERMAFALQRRPVECLQKRPTSELVFHISVAYQKLAEKVKQIEKTPMKPPANALLGKLHLKYSQKPWIETIKLVRLCLDRPVGNFLNCSLDHPVLCCQETLQRAIKAKSLPAVMSCIESISKQKGLESHLSPSGKVCYITSEMFYIEVQVKKNGDVVDVKLAHHGEAPTICEELLQFLRAKDFDAYGRSLEGLLLIYRIPGNSDIKAKVYLALQSLEADLCGMVTLFRPNTDVDRVATMLHGRVGNLSPRTAGTPMSIEYYASPYQLLEEKLNSGSRGIGLKLFVTVGGTNTLHRLPISRLLNESQQEDGSIPVFTSLTDELSVELPACFFLTFPEPVPLMLPFIQKIQNITGLPVVGTKQAPLCELIIQMTNKSSRTDGAIKETHFIVSIPDCMDHSYFISSRTEGVVMGVLVNKIPFTHPSHVTPTLEVIRHQAAYNTLISSCVSINRKDLRYSSDLLHFEVSLQRDTRFCISFLHPNGGSLSCVAIEVLSSSKLRCNLYTDAADPSFACNSEFVMKVMECCMSIPITMRAIFKRALRVVVDHEMVICSPSCEQLAIPETAVEILPDVCSAAGHGGPQEMESSLQVNAQQNARIIEHSNPDSEVGTQAESSQEPYSNITEESSSSIVEELSSSIVQENSCGSIEEGSSSIVEEGSSSILEEESSSIVEEGSSSIVEEESSSIVEEESSSIVEDPNSSIAELEVPESIPENDTDISSEYTA